MAIAARPGGKDSNKWAHSTGPSHLPRQVSPTGSYVRQRRGSRFAAAGVIAAQQCNEWRKRAGLRDGFSREGLQGENGHHACRDFLCRRSCCCGR